jgi:hypothetical protein
MCPDYPRVKVTLDPSAVWTYPTRTLTGFTGQPRIDLLGQDANIQDIGYTSTRASKLDNLDRLPSMEAFDTPIEGTVTMDGTEVTVVQDEITGNPIRHLEGWIDLSPMQSGDSVTIRLYVKTTPTGSYVKYAEETYTDTQSLPALHLVTLPARYGIKITMQQTAGTYRTFSYQFFRKRTT